MAKFYLTTQARLELRETWNYLAEKASIDVAEAVCGDIKAAIRKISESPGLGHRRQDLTDEDVLFYCVHRFLIIYDARKRPLKIARIVHASRNIADLF